MTDIVTKLWRNHQILFPPEVADVIGVKPSENVCFHIDDELGTVTLRKAED